MQVIVDVNQGKAIIGGREVPVEEVADKGGLQINGHDGPILRSVTFGERLRSIMSAVSASQPKDFLVASILHAATIQPGIGDNRILEILALKLAGADQDPLPLNEEAQSVARTTGWTLEYINDRAAIEIDHIAEQIGEKKSQAGWKQLFLVDKATDELEMIRNYLVNNLLRRADLNNAIEPLEDELLEHGLPPNSPITSRLDTDEKLLTGHLLRDMPFYQKKGKDKQNPFIPANLSYTIRNEQEDVKKNQPSDGNSKDQWEVLRPKTLSSPLTTADSDGSENTNRKPNFNNRVNQQLNEENTFELQSNGDQPSENLSTIRETLRSLNSEPWNNMCESSLSANQGLQTEKLKTLKHLQNIQSPIPNMDQSPEKTGIAEFSLSTIQSNYLVEIADALATLLDEEADMRGIDR